MLIVYPQSLTSADIFGQGNLNLVSEKSGNFTFYNLWEPCKICNLMLKSSAEILGENNARRLLKSVQIPEISEQQIMVVLSFLGIIFTEK